MFAELILFFNITVDVVDTMEKIEALEKEHLVDIVGKNMFYFVGKSGTYFISIFSIHVSTDRFPNALPLVSFLN